MGRGWSCRVVMKVGARVGGGDMVGCGVGVGGVDSVRVGVVPEMI